jgi:RHS repeat-associated protein
VISFTYDPFGRRIRKVSPAGATTIYVYDGSNIEEELNADGTLGERYTYGPGVDEPLVGQRQPKIFFYEADGLGSITSLTDPTGAVAATYTYDSFGFLTNSTGSATNWFRYTARQFDSDTALYYYRARYYDPTVGRFISEDPIGFLGGPNFYRYASNRPTHFADPYGFSDRDVQTLISGINNSISSMTANGQRLDNGYLNNLISGLNIMSGGLVGTPYLGCGQQTNNVIQQLTPLLPALNDDWTLEPQSGYTPLYHQWGAAISSNPDDPVIVFDPLHNNVYTVPANIWNNPHEIHPIK